MKHPFLTSLAAFACCSMLNGCAAVLFNAPDSSSSNDTSSNDTSAEEAEPVAQQNEEEQPSVDCDAFMQQLADACFKVTAFQADETTPLHVIDESGNDLGEVDQQWAAEYCECYAQLAFQTFGCATVISHENLDDEAYTQTYAEISNACASSGDDAAQSDAAQSDATQTDAAPEQTTETAN